ncbi:hypothetical protein HKCCE3408_17200 [Rhodobacterales bacterium HKCCE3408]|nr:hypothetical protein [Rhodobacterales bacterium HKCCE3408]
MTSQVDQNGGSAGHRDGTVSAVRAALSRPVVLALFVLCATQPYGLELGPLLIGPYRLVLLFVGPILMIQWLAGRFGRLLLPDLLVLGHSIWVLVSLVANGDTGRLVEWGGAQFIDTFFAYLLGRAAIRNRQDFYFFTRVLLWTLLFLLPFAILESTQGIVILIRIAEALPMVDPFSVVTLNYPPRLGLLRAQVGSAHPILYGVFCSMGFSFGLLGLSQAPDKPGFGKRLLLTAGSYLGTFFSLSSGAYVAVAVQGAMMLWDWVLRTWDRRWYAFAWGAVLFYALVAVVSERPPALTLARMVAFSASTAWNRYMIWQFGTAEVMRHPIFGMGLFSDGWQRSAWMSSSIDNQWLLLAMRSGLVGVGLLLGAYAYIIYRLIQRDFSRSPEINAIRKSMIFTFIALFLAYGTVASWHIQWSLLLVLMGGAIWIFDEDEDDAGPETPEGVSGSGHRHSRRPDPSESHEGQSTGSRYSRFPIRPRRGRPPD